MNPIVQGLEITVLGLAVTFTALGIFILVMFVLKRIFREKPENGDAQDIVEAEAPCGRQLQVKLKMIQKS